MPNVSGAVIYVHESEIFCRHFRLERVLQVTSGIAFAFNLNFSKLDALLV